MFRPLPARVPRALAGLACMLALGLGVAPAALAQMPDDEPGGAPTPRQRRSDEEDDEAAEQRRAAEQLEAEEEEEEEEEEGGREEEEPPAAPSIEVPGSQYEGMTVFEVQVRGVRAVADDDVRATISTQAGTPYSQSEIQRDARALWDLAFFQDIVVEALPTTRRGRRGVILRLTLRERPTIAHIRYEGNDEVDDDDIDDEVELREGAILSYPAIRRAVQDIRDLYAEKGFFLARVTYELERDEERNEVDVVFHIREGAEVEVRHVSFVGNDHLPADEIRAVMATRQGNFLSFLSSDSTFRRTAFERDVGIIQALYYDRGYLDVRVGTPRVMLSPDRRYIDIVVDVVEGPRFHIGRMRIEEQDDDGEEVEPLGGRRRLREMIHAMPGEWFSRTTIARDLLAITQLYRDRGYASVEIEPQTELDNERRIVHVTVLIRRGPVTFVERIDIRGNSKTDDEVIRREMQIAEGDRYSQTAIDESKRRIQALGYFERVDLSTEEGSAPNRIVIYVEVQERATGTFQVGAGFSSIESFIFTIQVQQQNLFGRGQSLTLQAQLSGLRQLATIQFVEPYTFGTEWTTAVDLFSTIRQFVDFNRQSTGGTLTLGHPILTDRLRLFLTYTGELVDVTTRTSGLFSTGSRIGNFGNLPLANLFRDGFTSALRLSLTYDSRDDRLFPTRGFYGSLSAEAADPLLGSENVFTRFRAFARFYYPLFAGLVFRVNTEWGLITSRESEGVPIFERFFLGGILDVRGFPLRSLGPRIPLAAATDPNAPLITNGAVVGGNMQAFYNVEIEFPILTEARIRGVVFTDGGNAWNLEDTLCQAAGGSAVAAGTSPCGVDLTSIRTSWGFGFRWFSPLGPLRFEWGLPFNPRSYERDITFEFTIGNFF